MNSLRVVIERNFRYIAVAVALLLVVALPVLTNAAQLTERSIALSSSSRQAENVSYDIKFKTDGSAPDSDAFIVQFCSNSPLVGASCTAPTGFSLSGATTATANMTRTVLNANTVMIESSLAIAGGANVNVVLDGVDNPTVAGPLYARFVTYETAAQADDYAAQTLGAGAIDDGGAAAYIHDTIGVSGAVLEALTFCVSSKQINADCAFQADSAPTLSLGEEVGTSGVYALSAGAVSEGSLFGQLSTNAVSGAVVSLKSSAAGCGGLVRLGGAPGNCDIKPALAASNGIAQGNALFGLKLGNVTDAPSAQNPNGTIQAYGGSGYNNSTFFLNFAANNLSGITGAFGDPFLDTDDAPVNNRNIEMIFGASVSNDTPAGLYSTDLSMIATGRF